MLSVFAASAIFSLLSRLSYSSKLDGVRRFAFGVLIFSVVSSPFISALGEIVHNGEWEILPPDYVTEGNSEEIFYESFCLGVKNAVCEKFNLKTGDVRVLAEGFSREGWQAEKIRIVLSGRAALADYHEIEDYINNMEIGECRAEIEIG